jgi:hypothetical protein
MEKLITKRLGIRNMTDADLVFIKSLRADEVCARYQRWEDNSEEHIRELIATHRHDVLLSDTEIQRFLIAMRDGAPVGTLTLFVTPKEDCITVGITIARLKIRSIKRCFVATAPVVFKFATTPCFLELGFSRIFCRSVVEIPRVVGVESESFRG